ncbi:MAG: Na/Pi symporter [Tenuifilaceae bacterium]
MMVKIPSNNLVKMFFLLGFMLLVLQSVATQEEDSAQIQHQFLKIDKYLQDGTLRSSGEKQYQIVGLKTKNPFQVIVTDSLGLPVKGIRVFFEISLTPEEAKDYSLDRIVAFTNSQGIAKTCLTLGDKEGTYLVIAKIKAANLSSYTLFTTYGRSSNWVFMLIIGLLGGVTIFFLGIKRMSDGLKHGSSEKLRTHLDLMSRNRVFATFFGALITMITQSSSATTVMLVGFVQSGLLKFYQTIGMIFGAAIGTTITVQLISFKLGDYSLLVVALGFSLLFSKKDSIKTVGESILGFGLLFYGMQIMSEAMSPLRTFEPFIEVLGRMQNPILGILAGTIFTAIIQSSAAFIGIILALSTQGLVNLETAIPLLMGANLGTSVTGLIAGIGSGRESKKVALAYTIFKLIGILMLFWFIQPFADLVRLISPNQISAINQDQVANLPRQIANAHTIFNVIVVVLLLPLTYPFSRLIEFLAPKEKVKPPRFHTKHMDENLLKTPSVAIKLAKQEVLELASLVQSMVNDILTPFTEKDKKPLPRIEETEENVDFLREQINSYILKITKQDIRDHQIREAFQVMYAVKELELIGDLVAKNLVEKAKWWIQKDYEFSDEGKRELQEFHQLTKKQLCRAIEVFENLNLEKAQKLVKKYEHYKSTGRELEHNHFERLKEDIGKSVTSSKTHLELVSVFRTIGSHANNISHTILEWPEK